MYKYCKANYKLQKTRISIIIIKAELLLYSIILFRTDSNFLLIYLFLRIELNSIEFN